MFAAGPFSSAPFSASGDQLLAEVSPAGIASAESFGAAIIVGPNMLVAGGLASAAAFGALALRDPGGVYPAGLASAEAFGLPSFIPPQSVTVSGIPAPDANFSGIIVMAINTIQVPSIPAPGMGVPTVQRAGSGSALPSFVRWAPVVRLNGVTVSGSLVGEVLVEVEEGAARLADFTLAIAAGTAINLPAYVGKAVEIDFAEAGGVNPVRLFTGVVDLPAFDFGTRSISFRCTDDLQGVVGALSRAQIDALVRGSWSAAVFDETADPWQYAIDQVSTVAGTLELSATRAPRFVSFVPASSPDYTFGASDIAFDGSVQVELANRDQIKNRVVVEFQHRFSRCKKRAVAVSHAVGGFNGLGTFGDFLLTGNWFLPNQMVYDAIKGTGWVFSSAGATFTEAPASGVYNTSGGVPTVWNKVIEAGNICSSFEAVAVKAYTQTITESYVVTVENAASVAAIGARAEVRQNALDASFDASAWESAAATPPEAGGAYTGAVVAPEVAEPAAGLETAVDYFPSDKTDRAAAAAAVRTMIAQAQADIYRAHRQNAVRFVAALVPGLDTDQTVQVETASIICRGKVRAVTHRMNLESGAATSSVDVAICSLEGLGYEHPAAEPTPPDVPDPAAINPAASFTTAVEYNNGPSQDHALTITLPAVDADSRDHYAPQVVDSRPAVLFEDRFEVTA